MILKHTLTRSPAGASGVWGLKKNFALLELLERLSLSRSNSALLPEVLIKQREVSNRLSNWMKDVLRDELLYFIDFDLLG